MPVFTTDTVLACPVEAVWDFLIHPANMLRVSPAGLSLVDGPDTLHLGARFTVLAQRWGISRRITSEVTEFEPGVLMVDEQREGPFGKWRHQHRLAPEPGGTRMTDDIEFEPPGGLLGFVVTARRIEEELRSAFAFRAERFRELLAG